MSDPETLLALIRGRARELSNAVAFTYLADGETETPGDVLSYLDLDKQARRVAAALQASAQPGDRAILLYPPGLDYICAFFGCLYAGVTAVPAYPPDPSRLARTLPRLQALVRDAQADVVLATETITSFAQALELAPDLKAKRWLATDRLVHGEESWQEPSVVGDTLAFLQYTSGSTGTPKGVMLSHANLLHNARSLREAWRIDAPPVAVGWLPLYHDMGLIGNVVFNLYYGGRCILMSPIHFLQRPLRWLRAISKYRGTISGGPNFAYDLCARKIAPNERSVLDLSCWDVAFNGAEMVRHDTLERFAQTFGPSGFRRSAFVPCYGLAEATLIVTGTKTASGPSSVNVAEKDLREKRVSTESTDSRSLAIVGCGQAAGEQHVVIVDVETRRPVDVGRLGEIWVSGPSVAHGYWNRPDESTETFAAHLADDGRRPFLRTGDLGFLLGSELYVAGRLKDMIVIQGANLYPHDIEKAVEDTSPALRPGCGAAFAVEIDQEEKLVVVQEVDAKRLATTDSNVTPQQLVASIRATLGEEFRLQPHAVVLLKPGTIPKTSSGKIMRYACRDAYLERTLDSVVAWVNEAPRPYVAPRDDLETALCEIWADVLQTERVGVHDDFFLLGGNSLLATQAISRIQARFELHLAVGSLFERPTPEGFANVVRAGRHGMSVEELEGILEELEG